MSGVAQYCALVLAMSCTCFAPAWSQDADAVLLRRIQQEVPPLLASPGSIARIDVVQTGPTKRTKRRTVTDPTQIATISRGLRNAILQQSFTIGKQFFSPRMTQEISFVIQGKPALRLISVGDAQFWMSWNEDRRASNGDINFQSRQFEKIADEYFPLSKSDPTIPGDFLLTIFRSGCEGQCPTYSVSVDRRGKVVWDGQQHVLRKGRAEKQIGQFQLRDIITAARDYEILSFNKNNRLCLDTPAVKVSLTMGGKTTRTQHDSCSQRKTTEGEDLAEFAQYAESQLGIGNWVKGN